MNRGETEKEGQNRFVALVGLAILFKLAALYVLAWNRRFVMDEFVQFGWAKYIPGQISYLATHHPKAAGYAFYYDLAHLIGWSARSMLLLGRLETALLGCATLGIVYATARTIGESQLRALVVVLLLLSFSSFIERIFETRAEPPALFFGAASLLVALLGEARKARTVIAAGILSGLAFLTTQKSLYFDVALGVALLGDAWLRRSWREGIARGAGLVLGWSIPVAIYCFIFSGTHPQLVADNLFFGPKALLSPRIASEYGGLRQYVVQTLARNALLYLFCFAGMLIASARIGRMEGRRRIALIFTLVITALAFAHDQPWPYVFIMALPFMALWALRPLSALASRRRLQLALKAVLGIAVAASFVRNIEVLRIDNHKQLELIGRAEALLGPRDIYFDGIGMLPNRFEPSTTWLDRHTILVTMAEGKNSDAYQIFARTPPKLILWSYRMDAIEPLVGSLIRDSYVRIAPNLWIAGLRLTAAETRKFDVPLAGQYALYDSAGRPAHGTLQIDGKAAVSPLKLGRGSHAVVLPAGAPPALLLPKGDYLGRLVPGPDDPLLFARVYD